jgi:hypothetical protein
MTDCDACSEAIAFGDSTSSLKQSCAGVIAEELGIANVFTQSVYTAVARYVFQLEYRRPASCSGGQEASP